MTERSGNESGRPAKKVDESWKDSVQKERTDSPEQATEASPAFPPADFSTHVSGLAYQAMIWLGLVPHPANDKVVETNLPQAKFFIDTLEMLAKKTQGNLTPEEQADLDGLLYELRLRFVEKQSGLSR